MKKIDWKVLMLSIAFSLGTGVLSSLLSVGSQKQYAELYQPFLAPPGWVFPVVWTILFILMGTAAYLVYESDAAEKIKKDALFVYGTQLLLNFGWPILFFRFHLYMLSLLWLLVLWYEVFRTYESFRKINVKAGRLLIPYLMWLVFAGYLNFAIAVFGGRR